MQKRLPQLPRAAFCGLLRLEEHEIHELDAIMHHASVSPKHTLFSQGDEATSLYTITSGTLRLHYDLPDGRRQIVGFAMPGDFLGLSLEPRFGLTPMPSPRLVSAASSVRASWR